MFSPKKYIKLGLLKSMPSIDDLGRVGAQARKVRGCTIELPWHLEESQRSFALAVRIEMGAEEGIWALYEGSGNNSHAMWSAPFNDMSLLKEVVSLSIADFDDIDAPNIKNVEPPIQEPLTSPEIAPIQTTTPQSTDFAPNINQPSYRQSGPLFYETTNPLPTQTAPLPGMNPPSPYVYFYPGYPYPIPMPYPPAMSFPQPGATSVPLQSNTPIADPNASSSRLPAPDAGLLRKQTSYMLGQFLIDAGLIRDQVLKIALKLQEMVAGNVIGQDQAIDTISRIHRQGGNLDLALLIRNSPTSGNKATSEKQSYPLLGDLLVKAQVIDESILQGLLKMQEVVRSGALSKDEAFQVINQELVSNKLTKGKTTKFETTQPERVIDLLSKAGLLSQADKETAKGVHKKHGGKIEEILFAAGKLSKEIYAAAVECDLLVFQGKIKLEQSIIALNYCERSRVNLRDALEELGFQADL